MTTEQRLRQAATRLHALLVAIATESPTDLPLHADGRTITQGRIGLLPYAEAETPEVAAFIATMGPAVASSVVLLLEERALIARHAPGAGRTATDQIALTLADLILGTPAGVSGE